jgi:phosphate acetyltransferase/phosphate butyryltransferase
MPLAVAHPGDVGTMRVAAAVAREGLARPLLVGEPALIERAAAAAEVALAGFERIDVPEGGSRAAAARAVALAREGAAAAVMKGSLHTDELIEAVANRRLGLHGDARLTHAFVFDLPRYHKLLAVADCVVNVAPNIKTKHDIVANGVWLLRRLGVASPKVAIVTAVETVSPNIPATVDARTLVASAAAGRFGDAVVEGPFGFDNAYCAEAARTKGMSSRVAGDADLLVMPDLNAGNILYKSFVYAAGAECAGILLGTRVPVVLVSRADSMLTRLASVALAVLAAAD